MESQKALSRTEMKNLKGGVIHMDTLYEMCVKDVDNIPSSGDSNVDYIVAKIGYENCAKFTQGPQ